MLKKTIVVGIIFVVSLFSLWIFDLVEKRVERINKQNVEIARILWAGTLFAVTTFPNDSDSTEADQLAFLQKQWHLIKNDMSDRQDDSYYDKFCDENIWTVVKSRPENPPSNLIVLATRNIDPSSLRTRLTDGDMQKRIRFDQHFVPPENLPTLKKVAVVIYADASRGEIGTGMKADTTYNRIYKGIPFDLTTNLVNGLQVKYLTTDGEVIPTND